MIKINKLVQDVAQIQFDKKFDGKRVEERLEQYSRAVQEAIPGDFWDQSPWVIAAGDSDHLDRFIIPARENTTPSSCLQRMIVDTSLSSDITLTNTLKTLPKHQQIKIKNSTARLTFKTTDDQFELKGTKGQNQDGREVEFIDFMSKISSRPQHVALASFSNQSFPVFPRPRWRRIQIEELKTNKTITSFNNLSQAHKALCFIMRCDNLDNVTEKIIQSLTSKVEFKAKKNFVDALAASGSFLQAPIDEHEISYLFSVSYADIIYGNYKTTHIEDHFFNDSDPLRVTVDKKWKNKKDYNFSTLPINLQRKIKHQRNKNLDNLLSQLGITSSKRSYEAITLAIAQISSIPMIDVATYKNFGLQPAIFSSLKISKIIPSLVYHLAVKNRQTKTTEEIAETLNALTDTGGVTPKDFQDKYDRGHAEEIIARVDQWSTSVIGNQGE